MADQDLYQILELSRGASQEEVRKAYKRLARKFHPDLNPGDKAAEERFKEISQAYEVLSNPEKKAQYDRFGTAEGFGSQGGPGIHFEGFDFGMGQGAGGFSDLFDSFFRTARSRREERPARGGDLVYPLHLSLLEAYGGKKTRITVRRSVACDRCGGSGRTAPARNHPCGVCGGTGKMGVNKGPLSFSRGCPACGGTGVDPGERCTSCGGTGRREAEERLDVSIPPGVDNGSKIRLKGKGQAGTFGGPPGDLLIETHIRADDLFRRKGPNLSIRVPVTYSEAVLGARIEVPTLTGSARLKIPPGTRSGQVFRLRGRGMPSLRGGAPGDLHVEVFVSVPAIVDEASKDLLRDFEKLNPESPRRELFRDEPSRAAGE